jgi:hypothetical protein
MAEITINLKIVYSSLNYEDFKLYYNYNPNTSKFNHLLDYISQFKTKKKFVHVMIFYITNKKLIKMET